MGQTSSFSVQFHGGCCCGIKNIWRIPHSPSEQVPPKSATKPPKNEARCFTRANDQFFQPAAPAEKAEDRLDRVIKYIIDKRPNGVIEIVLNQYQKPYWHDTLTSDKFGFKLITTAKNSNSNNTIHIYHKVH